MFLIPAVPMTQCSGDGTDSAIQRGAPCVAVRPCWLFHASPATQTTWREELVRVDHFSPKIRAMFRYIHDSRQTTVPDLWGCPDDAAIPNPNQLCGTGNQRVARVTATISPTLLNEFVFSYTADHIFLTNTGPGASLGRRA
jgi:hypothetical protein